MSRPIPALAYPGDLAPIADRVDWLCQMMLQMADASQSSAEIIADSYTVYNPPSVPRRQVNPLTDTAQDVAECLGTLLTDLHKRGVAGGTG